MIEYVSENFDNLLGQVVLPDSPVEIINPDNINVNDYLLELKKIPSGLIDKFNQDGWKISIDYDKIVEFGKHYNANCVGATVISEKTIYIANPNALLHEFGHYVCNKFYYVQDGLEAYKAEIQKAPMTTRCKSTPDEYFAEYFAMYTSGKTRQLKQLTPKTYEYFKDLSAQW